MDKPATAAVEPFVQGGYDLDAAAILLVESDGTPEEVRGNRPHQAVLDNSGATRLKVSQSEPERLRFWAGRQGGICVAASLRGLLLHGRHDPRASASGEVLKAIGTMSRSTAALCHVFHAGDGNLHP